jgi:predicted nucleic acid-binding protein
MSVYLDASVLVALFTVDALTSRADAVLRSVRETPIVSDFAGIELASAVSRRVRAKALAPDDARQVFETFDGWLNRGVQREELRSEDVATADGYLRRLDLTVRAPDALHIAMAQRLDATLLSFDEKMVAVAGSLGVRVLPG